GGKFGFSAIGASLVAEFIVLCNDLTLAMSSAALALHMLTMAVLALGLSGLSVGLGACMPNFRETDPSKIAVGFGGTLNLISGLLLLIVVIGLMTLPAHLLLASRGGVELTLTPGDWWLGLGVLGGLLIGVAAVLLPLRLGARALRRMEF